MKDSGIDYIGQIPRHWEIKKWRHLFKFGKGLTITKENLQEKGVPCVNYGEIHSKYPVQLKTEIHPLKCVSEDYIKKYSNSLISKGDFVFADTSEDLEGSGNFTCLFSDAKIFAGYHTITLKPMTPSSYSNYFAYHFDSILIRKQTRLKVQGVKVYSVSQKILKNNLCFYPPLIEQEQIANYLDCICEKIDATIKNKQQQIKLLQEYKKITITEIVSGQIDVRDYKIPPRH
ncbi:restriction endonuclease subunit S [Helicobacter sp. 11S03491-1]|uniref:restriction endonuclease subunit S n=1 Tax=Helicobacter sp. 11S03491-1 TaxID=1476196 RepID=UPI000BA6E425|nr:restriction endonuclease subunit S [Helicobacter sp. 11S03491-1]